MSHVFAKCHYGVLDIPGFFSQLHKYLGHFQIEQSIEDSHNQCFSIWFYTDKVEIKEGESRQIDLMATQNDDKSITFQIEK